MPTVCLDDHTPDSVLPIEHEHAALYADMTAIGRRVAGGSSVVFAACARNCGPVLRANLWRLEQIAKEFREWSAVVVENDSTDGTKQLLAEWSAAHASTAVLTRDNGRPHLHGFEHERMQALAEYRNAYLEWIRKHAPHTDYVVVLDLDVWGGYSGVTNGIGWLDVGKAGGMASVSAFQARMHGHDLHWLHYDQFAFRWLGWQRRMEPWFHSWLPPAGARPIGVCSAFGGLAVYHWSAIRDAAYAAPGGDCEHVGLHRSMNGTMHLNPSQRVIVHWEPTDAGEHGDDQRAGVPR